MTAAALITALVIITAPTIPAHKPTLPDAAPVARGLVWALWVDGSPYMPMPVAYFSTVGECERVRGLMETRYLWARCIQGDYR